MNPKLMGVVNVTPDSFSDGGLYLDAEAAIAHGEELVRDGADILDVGGESTRPGAEAVSAEEELARTEPVVAGLAAAGHEVSIDTSKLAVAEAALDAGASIVNDVTALRGDPEIGPLCAEREAGLVLMHMQGNPRTMQRDPPTTTSSTTSRPSSPSGSRPRSPPGSRRSGSGSIPVSASARPSSTTWSCCAGSASCARSGRPLVIGTSRKSFIGKVDGSEVGDRLGGTIASSVLAMAEGADVLRVHDVAEVAQAAQGRQRDPRIGWPAWRDTDESGIDSRVEVDLRGLSIYTHHGVSEAEQEVGQRSSSTSPSTSPTATRSSPTASRTRSTTARSATSSPSPPPSAATSTLERLAQVVGQRLIERYGCESVRVRASKPEPPLPLAIQEVAVEVVQERAEEEDEERGEED